MIPAFEPGNPIRLPVTFTDQTTPVGPTSVTLRITDPTGATSTQTYPAGNVIAQPPIPVQLGVFSADEFQAAFEGIRQARDESLAAFKAQQPEPGA